MFPNSAEIYVLFENHNRQRSHHSHYLDGGLHAHFHWVGCCGNNARNVQFLLGVPGSNIWQLG